MFKNNQALFLLLIVFLSIGCTKLSPELGFKDLDLSSESLTLETTQYAVNAQTANNPVQIKGKCETNTHLQLEVGGQKYNFTCENLKYIKEISSALLVEGENVVIINAFDDAENKVGYKEIKIIKDTTIPTVTLTGPSNISGMVSTISLSGTCSENGLDVRIIETMFSKVGAARCENNQWTYNHDISANTSSAEFKFTASHFDSVGNNAVTPEHMVSRAVLGDFNVTGVNTDGSANFGGLIKTKTGNLHVAWTSSNGAQSYNVHIQRQGVSGFEDICIQSGVTALTTSLSLSSSCSVNYGDELRIIVDANDSSGGVRLQRQFLFRVKAAPTLKADSKILYFSNETGPVSVAYSDIVEDRDSSGPFSLSVSNYGRFPAGEILINNSAAFTVNPTSSTSGIYDMAIRITDENGITSDDLNLKVIVTSSGSWAGLVDNDFNDRSNWCGSVTLKGGCQGDASAAPNSSTAIVIDNLCIKPTPATTSTNCAPALSAATTVKSFFMKDKTFLQNANSLNIGLPTSAEAFFRMTGGSFNMATSTGDITVNRSFLIEGGLFMAPSSSILTLNTQSSLDETSTFKVTSNSFFDHNNGTVILTNSAGQQLRHIINVPDGFRLKNLTINSAGGIWKVASPNLVVEGDLTFSGSKYASSFYPYLNGTASSSAIKLRGNLNCDGAFGGGDIPIHIESTTALYRSTMAGCKFPPLKVASGYQISEGASSTQNIVLQALTITGGLFIAPASPRNLIFRTKDIDDSTIIADIASGFDSNSGTVIFEGTDSSNSKNYKINLGEMEEVKFIGTMSSGAFYDIQNDFTTNKINFEGSYAARVRGAGKTVSTNQITMVTGLAADTNILSKIKLLSTANPAITVTTNSRINIPRLEISQNAMIYGTTTFDFTGTTFDLNTFNLYIPSGTLYYGAKTGSGTINGNAVVAP